MTSISSSTTTPVRDMSDSKRTIGVFAFMISGGLIFLVIMKAYMCYIYINDDWRIWRSPPCSAFTATWNLTTSCHLILGFIFLFSVCCAKSTLDLQLDIPIPSVLSQTKKTVKRTANKMRSSFSSPASTNASKQAENTEKNISEFEDKICERDRLKRELELMKLASDVETDPLPPPVPAATVSCPPDLQQHPPQAPQHPPANVGPDGTKLTPTLSQLHIQVEI